MKYIDYETGATEVYKERCRVRHYTDLVMQRCRTIPHVKRLLKEGGRVDRYCDKYIITPDGEPYRVINHARKYLQALINDEKLTEDDDDSRMLVLPDDDDDELFV